MNILVVTQYFWPENFRVNDLVEDFVARGHNVTVLTGQPNYPGGKFFSGYGWLGPREETYKGARVLRVPLVARGVNQRIRLCLNYLSFVVFGTLAVWLRLPRSKQFDTIFVFEISPVTVGIPAIAARAKFKAPIFFWVLDLWPGTLEAVGAVKSRRVLHWVEILVRWIYQHCARILIPSHGFEAEILRCGGRADQLRYLPNWGEPMFDQAQPIQSQHLPNLPVGKRFLYAGNIGEAQDFPTLLDAIEQLKERTDIQWIIIGDGRMAPWVRQEVSRRGLTPIVTLIGQQPLDTMPAYFAAADVLFLALKSDPVFEKTIPGKLQSYLASGKPVLAMLDGEGARVLEESQAGVSVPAGNSAALMHAIEAFAAMPPSALLDMQTKARHYYEAHFARNHVLSQLESWMKELT